MKLLVTTGATAPFDDLISACLSDQVLHTAEQLGFTSIRVQYGHSKDRFDRLSSKQKGLKNIEISGFSFTTEIVEEIRTSRLVISHAGTGSILDCFCERTPLIAVPNNNLMDDHQREIADRFSKSQALLIGSCNANELAKTIEQAMSYDFHIPDEPDSHKISDIICRQAGII